MSGSAKMQFLPTLSLAVTRARELWRADSRAAVSGGWGGGGGIRGGGGGRVDVEKGSQNITMYKINARLAYLDSAWVSTSNLKRCSLHQLKKRVQLKATLQHRCLPLYTAYPLPPPPHTHLSGRGGCSQLCHKALLNGPQGIGGRTCSGAFLEGGLGEGRGGEEREAEKEEGQTLVQLMLHTLMSTHGRCPLFHPLYLHKLRQEGSQWVAGKGLRPVCLVHEKDGRHLLHDLRH